MKKFNQFEAFIIREGLIKVKEQFLNDIKEAEKKGKTHIFSPSYVDYIIDETNKKLTQLTIKK